MWTNRKVPTRRMKIRMMKKTSISKWETLKRARSSTIKSGVMMSRKRKRKKKMRWTKRTAKVREKPTTNTTTWTRRRTRLPVRNRTARMPLIRQRTTARRKSQRTSKI
uniref:(northern house mosquito) hypothetical protein n=1 Tax=Culex pipiens TaxID=7175 RepID=A0A8D8JLF4_CULPI